MRLIFCRANDPISWGVRLLTWSEWSHVGIVDGSNVIEAWFPYVRVSSLTKVIQSHSRVAFKDIYCKYPAAAISAAVSQVGKPYDVKAIIGWPLGRVWQDDNAWFCAELVAWAFMRGSTTLFPNVHRVTPQDLWEIN